MSFLPAPAMLSRAIAPLLISGLLFGATACRFLPRTPADAQQQGGERNSQGPPSVEVAIAEKKTLDGALEYTGTTRPVREVVLRSQIQGQLLSLSVDIGDRVSSGDILGQVDDALLQPAVLQAEAELAARQSEVSQLSAQASEVRARIEQARLQLQQAQADAERLQNLARDGAIAEQQAEQAVTAMRTAEQVLRSAQDQLATQQQAIVAAQRRVTAQEAVIAEASERQSYGVLTSPISGAVLERLSEPGNLLQPGSSVLRLGDFSQVKVEVEISELDLADLAVGKTVQVRLDALPMAKLTGKITRISPAADPVSRLIPVEVTIPNPDNRIGSGLLARVSLLRQQGERVVVPQTALALPDRRQSGENKSEASKSGERKPGESQPRGNPLENRPSSKTQSNQGQSAERTTDPAPAASDRKLEDRQRGKKASDNKDSSRRESGSGSRSSGDRASQSGERSQLKTGILFVLSGSPAEPQVVARTVQLGQRSDGQVEILSGLNPGERYIARSSRPLKDGETVRLSVLSQTTRLPSTPDR